MARADLLIEIVRAGAEGDQALFQKALEAMITKERSKQHNILADRLAEHLNINGKSMRPARPVAAVPNGEAKLFHEVRPRRGFGDLLLPPLVQQACSELVEEHNRADLLRAHNLEPRNRVLLVGPPGNGKISLAGRVYLMFASQRAFRQLLNLWNTWQRGENFQRGLTKWRDVFALLRDIRPWSVRDRLEETGVLEDWRDRLTWERQRIPCEIELWFRADEQQRAAASAAVRFFRASGQMAGRITVDQVSSLSSLANAPLPDPETPPVVALLDGLPLQSHRALAGRLTIDDPDDFGADYEARFRLHGTAMASLIIWGDLHSPGEPIPQPLYVRPIMQPFTQPGGDDLPPEERVSEGLLIVDLIHRAVRRMFEGEGNTPATAPNVSVINLSIGIADRPFDGTMSPLARLLDWLSWKYDVLFLVSAGNHGRAVNLKRPWSELATSSPEELRQHVAKAIAADARHRRLLSPAEGMNVLTVGATHEDGDSAALRPNWIDPADRGFPSPLNAQGQGYKRSVKPDVLAPGGRAALVKPVLDTETELAIPRVTYRPGQLVATPGPAAGDVSATVPSRGTSNATALMSRAAALLAPVLAELRETQSKSWQKLEALHGAETGQIPVREMRP